MIFMVILVFIVGFQFLVIISLCADRTVILRQKGDFEMNALKMSNEVFDVLKWFAMLFLPALSALVKIVFAVWQIPYGEEISTTIMALDAFLGAILGISHIQYKKGDEK